MGLQLDEEGFEKRLELGEALFAVEALVEAEGGEDDVGLVLGEVLVEVAKAIGARAEGHFVGGPAEVAEDELLVGKALMHEGLELAVVAHAIEKRIADEGDACAGFQLQRELGESRNGKQEAEEEALHEMGASQTGGEGFMFQVPGFKMERALELGRIADTGVEAGKRALRTENTLRHTTAASRQGLPPHSTTLSRRRELHIITATDPQRSVTKSL
jgi:hypothetical protein